MYVYVYIYMYLYRYICTYIHISYMFAMLFLSCGQNMSPAMHPQRLPGIDNGCTAKNCLAGTTTGGDDR